jgi:Trk-type K+ transport system membrane component
MTAYLAIVVIGFFALLVHVPEQSADRLLMLSISAAGNVGLSHDVLSVTGSDAFVLSAVMLAGRLAPLLILYWLASTRERHEIVVA